jgi:ribA/ribD-fused uncharacterized protein
VKIINEVITDEHVFFYKGVFSQWYLHNFEVEILGRLCSLNCAEQGMMLGKALYFHDEAAFEKIAKEQQPSRQKALGRKVKGFNKAAWEDGVAKRIVYTVNFAKFTSSHELKIIMLATGARKFVEASPTDDIWGIKRSLRDPLIHNPAAWRGTNWLGEVLTDVKESILRMSYSPEDDKK